MGVKFKEGNCKLYIYIVPIFHMCNPPDVLDTSEGQNNLFSVKVIELRSNNKVKKY